ncbi:helix-turn-helix domain-containing protein [Desulfitobacterium hafniense]
MKKNSRNIQTDVLVKICKVLQCDVFDIVQIQTGKGES